MIASLIFVLIFSTAFVTPFPKYLSLSPSLSSKASNSPVEAPLGAVPLPTVPSAKYTSASTVGLPLESIISLPITFSISNCVSSLTFLVVFGGFRTEGSYSLRAFFGVQMSIQKKLVISNYSYNILTTVKNQVFFLFFYFFIEN